MSDQKISADATVTPAGADFIPIVQGGANKKATLNSLPIPALVTAALGNKVDKVTGKGLSTEDYSSAEKSKLAGIEAGAEVNTLNDVIAGTNITIDKTDPLNPIISSSGGAGSGDVVGPTSAIGDDIVIFDSNTGKIIKDGGSKISDLVKLNGVSGGQTLNGGTGASEELTLSASSNVSNTGFVNVKNHIKTLVGSVFAFFDNSGNQSFSIYKMSASAVNSLAVTNEATGTGPTIGAISTVDSNIDINLAPKGTGVTRMLSKAISNALNIVGTAGTGFITLIGQSSNPTAPAAGTLLLHSRTTNGITRLEQDNESTTNLVYGRDTIFIINNNSGGALTKGQVVYQNGTTAGVPTVGLSRANSATTVGEAFVVVDNMADGAYGQGMKIGILGNMNTNAFSANDTLYTSTSVAGGFQNTRPSGTSGAFVQRIGKVLVQSATVGVIEVCIAPFVGNMETGTTAATFAASAITGTTITASTGFDVGNADTSITRVSAGKIAVEGVNVGTEGILQNSQSANYTTVLTDAGKHIYHPSADTTARTITIDSNANVSYPIGTAITFINDTSAGVMTIAITSDTMVLAGAGTTGSRTLAANGMATAVKITSTRWMISGSTSLT